LLVSNSSEEVQSVAIEEGQTQHGKETVLQGTAGEHSVGGVQVALLVPEHHSEQVGGVEEQKQHYRTTTRFSGEQLIANIRQILQTDMDGFLR